MYLYFVFLKSAHGRTQNTQNYYEKGERNGFPIFQRQILTKNVSRPACVINISLEKYEFFSTQMHSAMFFDKLMVNLVSLIQRFCNVLYVLLVIHVGNSLIFYLFPVANC